MSNGLSKYEVNAMAQKAGCAWLHEPLAQRFATLCRAPLVAENAAMKQAHEINADTLNAMQVEIDDWKARALKAEQAGESTPNDVVAGALYDFLGYLTSRRTRVTMSDRDEAGPAVDALVDWSKTRKITLEEARVEDWQNYTTPPQPAAREGEVVAPLIKQITEAICAGQKQRSGKSNKGTSQIPWTHTVGACAEVGNGANEHLQYRVGQTNAERSDHQCNSGCSGVSSGGAVCGQVTPPQPAAQEQTSAVPLVRQMVEALERKLPGGKQTDDFESSRIGDYNQGWNDYRKAVKKMFKNINMNSSENSNPDAYLYSLEYGEKVVDTKVSIHQLNYPFGVAGADYLVRNDDGVSYVRQTKLYAALSRALAAGQKFIKENGK